MFSYAITMMKHKRHKSLPTYLDLKVNNSSTDHLGATVRMKWNNTWKGC